MGSIKIPGYKILRTLGVGGQATVYLAIQQGFEREVALKVMSPALAADPTFGERFLREAKIVAKLRHQGIVTVYDVGEHDGFYYLAMEYLPGTDLRCRINQGLKAKEALQIIQKVARALDFAHQKGYIHRDVKSENILFGDDENPLLTDFGIAKASNSSTQMTQAGKLIGTPQYMSPEQCRGRKLDGRSDLYSLGIIFHEMLMQTVPYDGEDSVAVCLQHVTKPIPKLPSRHSHYQWLLDRLMAKKPEDRYATGSILADELEKFLAGNLSQSNNNAARLVASREHDISEVFAQDETMVADGRVYQTMEVSRKKRWPWVVGAFSVIGIAGFLQQDLWLPKAQQVLSGVMNKQTQTEAGPTLAKKGEQQNLTSKKVEPKPIEQKKVLSNKSASDLDPEGEARQKQIAELLIDAKTLEPLQNLDVQQMRTLLQNYVRVLIIEPKNETALAGKQRTILRAGVEAERALNQDNELEYGQFRGIIEQIDPGHSVLTQLTQKYQSYQENQQYREQQKALQSQVVGLLQKAQKSFDENRLTSPENNSALYYYSEVLKLDPKNDNALKGMVSIKESLIKLAQKQILNRDLARARSTIGKVEALDKSDIRISELNSQFIMINNQVEQERKVAQEKALKQKKEQERLERLADPLVQLEINSLLNAARIAFSETRLVEPKDDNALMKYRAVLDIDDRQADARNGIVLVENKLTDLVKEAVQNGNKSVAEQWLNAKVAYFPSSKDIPVLKQLITEMQVTIEPVSTIKNESSDAIQSQTANQENTTSEQVTTEPIRNDPASETSATKSEEKKKDDSKSDDNKTDNG